MMPTLFATPIHHPNHTRVFHVLLLLLPVLPRMMMLIIKNHPLVAEKKENESLM